ncbi:hypothetical protein [Paenibacillus macquariensis]|uniref:Uncharacterized protein n=1 Tax=Paenibacillus macquariensis TaxID=948756 RepID=A0ABY1KED6_9BACL|nr:hypothetical protein [Paenibacillus macquariensis]OAB33114.1 hypothetical protein PMSM_16340 [Paenibacillus macquariensis subsp. macquariensis]SIR70711.1 hypothetical protein SAMN05421578_13818 [Paenibacillus macquariensis]
MKARFYQIIGIIFVIFSGLLHTLERCANFVASGLSSQGLAVFSGNGGLSSPWIDPKDNVFVIPFLVIGIVAFLYGLVRNFINRGH